MRSPFIGTTVLTAAILFGMPAASLAQTANELEQLDKAMALLEQGSVEAAVAGLERLRQANPIRKIDSKKKLPR